MAPSHSIYSFSKPIPTGLASCRRGPGTPIHGRRPSAPPAAARAPGGHAAVAAEADMPFTHIGEV
jgi:hypothetical protein